MILKLRSILIYTLFLLLPSIEASAFYTKQYNTSNSLASNNVYFVFKDKKGYLWFLTDKGVSKFDGEQFRNFTLYDGLGDNEIFKAYEDRMGRLWLFTHNGSPCYIYNDRVYNAANDSLLKKLPAQPYMNEMYEDQDSSFYIGYSNGSIIRVLGNKISWVYDNLNGDNLSSESVNAIYRSNGLINARSRLYEFSTKDGIVVGRNPVPLSVSFFQKDKLLVADKAGIKIYRNDTLIWKLDSRQLNTNSIIRLYFNDDGYLFCCTYKGLIIINTISGEQWKLFQNIATTCVAKDVSGNFWVSTLHHGVYFIDKNLDNVKLVGDISGYDFTYTKSGQLFFEDRYNAYTLSGKDSLQIRKVLLPFKGRYHPLYLDEEVVFYISDSFPNQTYYYNTITKKTDSTPEFAKYVLPSGKDEFLFVGFYALYDCIWVNHRAIIRNIIDFDCHRVNMPVLDNKRNFYCIQNNYVYEYNTSTQALIKIDSFPANTPAVNFSSCGQDLILTTNNQKTFIYREPGVKRTIQSSAFIYDAYKLLNGDNLLFTNNGYYISHSNSADTFDYGNTEKVEFSFRQNDLLFLYPYGDKIVCNVGGKLYAFSQQLLAPAKDTPSLFIKKILVEGKAYASRDIELYNVASCNIKLELATLHFNSVKSNFEYRIITGDKAGKWNIQPSGDLNILLTQWGACNIEIRAITENNIASSSQVITLKIHPPFYYTFTFYIAVAVFILLLSLYLIYRSNKKRKQIFQNELNYLQLENKAINSLMNPHFIFNAINNIQGIINTGSLETANNYLVTLSRLIRQNMENLQFNFISVEKELKLLQNYIYLQNMRFGKKIVLQINDNTQCTDEIKIPPLLIHTFVENAIVHGFTKETSKYLIVVDLDLSSDDYLIIKVKDNGVGYSAEQSSLQKDRISLGIDFTKRRLQRLSDFYKVDYTLEINSITGKENSGTEVLIIIYSKFQELKSPSEV